ncbi:MAG: SDR family oxidoreductase [Rhodospirillales bacterium]|nr:SDR family oxidoreductase [Rhodospirillales bacterium]MBO6787783.1 SDR family oxidoreductase [Rhodospirillales bacterium]
MSILENHVAIVTGASSGIGHAAAKLFAKEGAHVVVGARRETALNELVAEIGEGRSNAVALPGDVADEAFQKALVDLAVSRFGGLDIAFNNAGMLGELTSTPEMTADNWQNVMDVNLTSGFLGAKYQVPAMQKRNGGSIIFTSSFVGYTTGMPGMSAYGASKAGLVGLTLGLASEFGQQGIRVNALLPGGTDTAMAREVANTPEIEDYVRRLHAMKRTASPGEIAEAALFLASGASSFMTGQTLIVDGGFSVHRA